MRHTVLRFLAAAVLVAGGVGLLAGCTTDSTEQPALPIPSQPSHTDDVPLGLSVRYVDENGRFVTMSPEDFPR